MQERVDELTLLCQTPSLRPDTLSWADIHREHGEKSVVLSQYKKWVSDVGDWMSVSEDASLEFFTLLKQESGVLLAQAHQWLGDDNRPEVTLLTIQAGVGGCEAQDWAKMLATMYTKCAARMGWPVDVVSWETGAQGGLSTGVLRIQSAYSFSYFQSEAGVHRLVRVSPFDSQKRTHTSFALVCVDPEISNIEEINISPADVRIDVMRSSGAGGQHVNKTESCVRITHLESGIQVTCQNSRSQHANKKTAWSLIRAKLQKQYSMQKSSNDFDNRSDMSEIGWGQHMRTYHVKENRVKNHKTGLSSHQLKEILNGDLSGLREKSAE